MGLQKQQQQQRNDARFFSNLMICSYHDGINNFFPASTSSVFVYAYTVILGKAICPFKIKL